MHKVPQRASSIALAESYIHPREEFLMEKGPLVALELHS